MRPLIFFLILISFWLPVDIGETDSRVFLVEGKQLLDDGKYEEAIAYLSTAAEEFPLLGDYALFWLCDAFHEYGNHLRSLITVRTLLKKYPRSPLVKRARIREIQEAEEISESKFSTLYESFLRDYPSEMEMKYLYAQWLKRNDHKKEAKKNFKEIYIDAGPFSDIAYIDLAPSDIRVQDIIDRASNLIKKVEYETAEKELRNALGKAKGRLYRKIMAKLGYCLFRQKKYRDAAGIYRKINETYWEIRSLYRAGQTESVKARIEKLFASKDSRMATVLIAIAADKRRSKHIKESIKFYERIAKRFPGRKEDALWGIGWTYFISRQYSKAADVFSGLSRKYRDPQYRYWYARSLEQAGEKGQKEYRKLLHDEREFYGILSYARNRDTVKETEPGEYRAVKAIRDKKETPALLSINERVEALFDLGLSREALLELEQISKKPDSMADIIYTCSKFQTLGAYEQVVRLAARVPYNEKVHRFVYPLAFDESITKLSRKYRIDPHLVLSVIREESRFDRDARSPAGALGLMQLMPYTAQRLDRILHVGIKGTHDILDVNNNLHLGIYYLSQLVREFGSYPPAVAAYNAGEKAVRKWKKLGNYPSSDVFIEDIPYSETKKYVKRVLTTYFQYKRLFPTEDGLVEIPLEKL
jgi:soluble lytic murein transglycosylase